MPSLGLQYDTKPTRHVPAPQPSSHNEERECVRKCKRFLCWRPWALPLILLIFLSLISCMVFFVAFPEIARTKLSAAKLDVQGVSIIHTTHDSFEMSINSTISAGRSSQTTVDGFSGKMYIEGLPNHSPFAAVDFPEIDNDGQRPINITQRVNIKDRNAFNTFSAWFFNNETLRVTIDGFTKIRIHGLQMKYRVHFNKILEYKALNGLSGTQITDGRFLTGLEGPHNFNGTANIPNKSLFTLEIGNTTFASFIDYEPVGNLTIDHLVLRPGSNLVPIKANFDLATALSAASSNKYCKTGVIPLKLQSTSVLNNGEHLEYFEEAFSSSTQIVNLDLGRILERDLHTTLSCPLE